MKPITLLLAPGAAEELPENYLEPVITSWLDELSRDVLSDAERFVAAMKGRDGSLGNPVWQKRVFDRMSKALGDRLIYAHLTTGKRKKFFYFHDILSAVDRHTWKLATEGRGAWLAVVRRFEGSDGYSHPIDKMGSVPCMVTRHATLRIAQRLGALTAADVVTIFRAAWPMIATVERVGELLVVPEGTTFHVPARLPGREDPAVFVCTLEKAGFMVKTVLLWSLLWDRQRDACQAFLDATEGMPLQTRFAYLSTFEGVTRGIMNL